MPESEWEGLLGHAVSIRRFDEDLKLRLERIIQEARKYDHIMETEGLITIDQQRSI